jgi:xylulose-5-phosphate/fructose-6-phosphate phosphoketolase
MKRPALMHEAMAATLDTVFEEIKEIRQKARANGYTARPRWPIIVLNSPKDWTGSKVVDGVHVEGDWRNYGNNSRNRNDEGGASLESGSRFSDR